MKARHAVPIARLHELFSYNPETGLLTRKIRQQYQPAGKIAGRRGDSQGHLACNLDGVRIYVHRIAWAMHYGAWPDRQIDHINRIPDDNRISNLRQVTNAENQQNRNLQSLNKSGVTGVSKRRNKWQARINVNGTERHLGVFENLADAIEARRIAERELHPCAPAVAPSPYPELTPTGAALTYVVRHKKRLGFDTAVQAAVMRLQGMRGVDIAKKLGCSPNYANEVLKGNCNPSAAVAAKAIFSTATH